MSLNKNFSQHKKRQIIIAKLYQYILEKPETTIFANELDQELKHDNISAAIIAIINDILWYQSELVAQISAYLKPGWIFRSLKPVEQAILLLASYEILYTTTEAAIIINEAVNLAKEYCSENSYRYINGILDKISKNKTS